MKYEVIVCQKEFVVLSWNFKSINMALKFCSEINLSLVDVHLYRRSDFKEFNVPELLDLYYGG